MTCLLFEFVKSYLNGNIEPKVFSRAYIELYRIAEIKGLLPDDDDNIYLSSCLYSLLFSAQQHDAYYTNNKSLLSDKELFVYVKTELERLDIKNEYWKKNKTTFK